MSTTCSVMYSNNNLMRLDIFLSNELNINRSQSTHLIKKQLVKVNGKIAKKCGFLIKLNDLITIDSIQTNNVETTSNLIIDRIYEDSHILVINKPPFLVVHPASSFKGETLVDWLRANKIVVSNISGENREGIVHRLDKQTSGAMVIAKTNEAHNFLSKQLFDRTLGRLYLSIIDLPLKDDITIECYLARHPNNRLKIAKTTSTDNARYAKSNFYKLLLSNDGRQELILAKLETGRTHQIRAHLASINRHIVGDDMYGYKGGKYRIMLHSYILFLEHIKLGRMSFKAELFDDMMLYLNNNFDMEKINEILCHIASNYDT